MADDKKKFMERTPELLQYVADNSGCTSSDMAGAFGLARSTCAVKLGQFYDRQWVNREKTVPKGVRGRFAYAYTITDRGQEKLDYWEQVQDIIRKQEVGWGEARRLYRVEKEI